MPVVLQTVPILHISKFQLFQLNYLLDLYICFTAPQTVPFFPAICTFTLAEADYHQGANGDFKRSWPMLKTPCVSDSFILF